MRQLLWWFPILGLCLIDFGKLSRMERKLFLIYEAYQVVCCTIPTLLLYKLK